MCNVSMKLQHKNALLVNTLILFLILANVNILDFNTVACPSGCATCLNENECETCILAQMSVNNQTRLCQCPNKQFYQNVGTAQCRNCMERCQTCNTDFSCLTYAFCPNQFQTLTNGTCSFGCTTGSYVKSSTCGTCTDTNCRNCLRNGTQEQCLRCQNGIYLDLSTYSCVSTCPTMSKPISSANVVGNIDSVINYCRPYVNNTLFNYAYYVDSNSRSHVILGTKEHPFKQFETAFYEIFNYVYENTSRVEILFQKNTTYLFLAGIRQVYLLNLAYAYIGTYGNQDLSKPIVYMTNWPYLTPDNTQLTIAESRMLTALRISRGDLTSVELGLALNKITAYRTNVVIDDISFQSIFKGTQIANFFFACGACVNFSVTFNNLTIDSDGGFYNSDDVVLIHFRHNKVNLTNPNSGLRVEPTTRCASLTSQHNGKLFIENNIFHSRQQQATSHYVLASIIDDIYIINNTFSENCSWTNLETRPMFKIQPNQVCDLSNKTQEVVIRGNKFMNLTDNNIVFSMTYIIPYSAIKTFVFSDNIFTNTRILVDYQITNNSTIQVARNTFTNASIDARMRIVNVNAGLSTIMIRDNTFTNCTLDDFVLTQRASLVNIDNTIATNIRNTGFITQTSSFMRILSISISVRVERTIIANSSFQYGKVFEITDASNLEFINNNFSYINMAEQDLIILTRVRNFNLEALEFDSVIKKSQNVKAAILINSISLAQNLSKFSIREINYKESQASFISLNAISVGTSAAQTFMLLISDVIIENNTLSGKDNIFSFGYFNVLNFTALLSNVQIRNTSVGFGSILDVFSNFKDMLLTQFVVSHCFGRFLKVQPSSTDSKNPMIISIQDSSFTQNSGFEEAIILVSTNTYLNVKNTTFSENYSTGRGSIIFADFEKAVALFDNCTFIRNYAYHGGIFYTTYQNMLEFSNSLFQENFAVVGAVGYVNNDGIAKINNNSKLIKNQALNTCLVIIINSRKTSYFNDIQLSKNDQANAIINKNYFLSLNSDYKHLKQAYFLGLQDIQEKIALTVIQSSDFAFQSIFGDLILENIEITENQSIISASTDSRILMQNISILNTTTDSLLIQGVLSLIEIEDLLIQNLSRSLKNSGNYLLSIEGSSQLYVRNVTFDQVNMPILYITESSMVSNTINLKNISNNHSLHGIIVADIAIINLKNVNIDNVKQTYARDIISLINCTTSIDGITVQNIDKTLMSGVLSQVVINAMSVTDFNNQPNSNVSFNSLVFSMQDSDLEIKKSHFYSLNTYQSSPVISITQSTTDSQTRILIIEDSIFNNNTANMSAGVLLVSDVNLVVNRSVFTNNEAKTQSAGAIMLQCSLASYQPCTYIIENSVFINNTAAIDGGAIQFDYFEPNTSKNCTFQNNKAQYGINVASYAAGIEIISKNQNRYLTEKNRGLNQQIIYRHNINQVSGQVMSPPIQLSLIDSYGHRLITDNSSTADLISVDDGKVQILKSKSVIAKKGIFTFDDVLLIAQPNDTIQIRIFVDSISKSKLQNAFPLYLNQELILEISMRQCIRGEYQSADLRCVLCSDGFYSLQENQQTCLQCPDNAKCQDGFKIIPNNGYWKSDINSNSVYECYNSDSCISAYEPTCSPGYGGNLCQSCVQHEKIWYQKTETKVCRKCPEYWQNTLQLAGVTLILIVYYLINVAINIKTASQQKVTTVYMRILTNYFQILALARDYDLSWQDSTKKFLQYLSFVSEASDIIISQDCFIRESTSRAHPLFIKLMIACFFPLIGICTIIIGWYLLYQCKRKIDYKSNIIATLIIFVFISLPPIMSLTFDAFNCKDIFNDGDTYLVLDMNIKCWSGDHDFYTKAFGIPIMIVWVIALPLTLLCILHKNKNQLFEEHTLFKLGFLYIGLNQKAYYWEILIYYQKVAMASINIFFQSFEPFYRALLGFIILIIYIEILQKVNPYQSEAINRLEFFSIIAAVIFPFTNILKFATFYGGLIFINDNLTYNGQITLMLCIIAFNAYFWYYWFSMIFSSQHTKLQRFFVIHVCPQCCLRKSKKVNTSEITSQMSLSQEQDSSTHFKRGNSHFTSIETKQSSRKMMNQNSALTIPSQLKVLYRDLNPIPTTKKNRHKMKQNHQSPKLPMIGSPMGVSQFDRNQSNGNLVMVKTKKNSKETNYQASSISPNKRRNNILMPQNAQQNIAIQEQIEISVESLDFDQADNFYKQESMRVRNDLNPPMLKLKTLKFRHLSSSSKSPNRRKKANDPNMVKEERDSSIPAKVMKNKKTAVKIPQHADSKLDSIIDEFEEEIKEMPESHKYQPNKATAFTDGQQSNIVQQISYIKKEQTGSYYSIKHKKRHVKLAFQEEQETEEMEAQNEKQNKSKTPKSRRDKETHIQQKRNLSSIYDSDQYR